jgi:hypothetical protein
MTVPLVAKDKSTRGHGRQDLSGGTRIAVTNGCRRVRRLCTYVVRENTGLAPNPFWEWCSLAVCTPNHQGTRLTPGDWIAGCLGKSRGHRLLYAMEVAMVLDLDEYFKNSRFQSKKPNLRGDWKERCGDNFYSRDSNGSWVQHRNRFHLDESLKRQDTKFARVFLGRRYWYRGKSAAPAPAEFAPLLWGRGARVNHNPDLRRRLWTGLRGL